MLKLLLEDIKLLHPDLYGGFVNLKVIECYQFTNTDAEFEIRTDDGSARVWIPKSQLRKDLNNNLWVTEIFAKSLNKLGE